MGIPLRTGYEEASYVIYEKDRGSYYAKDGRTGDIAYGGPNNVGGVSGSDAAAVIQAAINALTSGGKILIRAGTYVISSTLVINRDYTWLCGEGFSSVLQAAIGLNSEILRISGGASYGEISYLQFDGNRAANTSSTVLLQIISGSYSSVIHCYFYNGAGHAIYLHTTEGVSLTWYIEDNEFRDIAGDGVRGERGSYNLEGIYILNNHMGGLATGYAIHLITVNEAWIISNSPVGWLRGVSIDNANTNLIYVIQNVFDTIQREGVYSNGQEIWIEDNFFLYVCLEDTYDAIYIDGDARRNLVLHNDFVRTPPQNPRYAIYAADSGHVIFDNVINTGAYVTAAISSGLNYNWVKRNQGWVTENHGTAVFLNGWATVYVSHGLAAIPTIVLSTGRHSETYDIICTARDATGISLQASAPVTGDRTVDWYAEV